MIQIPLKAGHHRPVSETPFRYSKSPIRTFSVYLDKCDLYVRVFVCICFRNGKRVFCDGPFSITFQTYQFPPNQVKWCEAERDLWKTFGLTFDHELNEFNPTLERKLMLTISAEKN